MADLSYSCDVSQGFNFQRDVQTPVGVVSSMYWEGGYANPMQFSCQISNENKKTLTVLAHSEMSDTTVEFSYTIYDYDPDEKTYYKCFHTDGEALKGLVEKAGGELSIAIDTDQSNEVVSPKNFTLSLGVMPEDQAQNAHFAVSVSDKLVKVWGVTVEA